MGSWRLAAAAVLAIFAAEARAEPARTLRVVTVAPQGSAIERGLLEYGARLEKDTGGAVRLRVAAEGVAGDELSTLDGCIRGHYDMWAGSTGAVAARVKAVNVFEVPYALERLDLLLERGLVRELRAGAVGGELRAAGLVPLVASAVGWRGISSRKAPVRRPSDLAGMRVRSQNSPVHLAMWQRLGVPVRTVELTELASGFQIGYLDTFDVPVAYVFATSLAGQVKYHTRTGHLMQVGLLVMNRGALDRLPRKVQERILALGAELSRLVSRANEKEDADLVRELAAAGTQVIELTAPERASWREALLPLHERVGELAGPGGLRFLRWINQARAK